ncbi:MAG TPA: NUDIX hydrolase [Candidatus Paceibacterota bacterium]
MNNILNFKPSYASFGAGYFLNHEKEQIDVMLALSQYGDLPYGFPGGKENAEDGKDPIKTANREWDEESRLRLINPSLFYTHRRRNDDGSGSGFSNYFYHSQEEGNRREPQAAKKDSIKEVKWFSMLEAEAMPLKLSHLGALIELCYHLEETQKDSEMAMAYLKKLALKMFVRPSTLWGTNRIKEKPYVTPYLNRNPNGYFPWHSFIKEFQGLNMAA